MVFHRQACGEIDLLRAVHAAHEGTTLRLAG